MFPVNGHRHPRASREEPRRAFTLVELLVVVAIMVSILALAVPAMTGVNSSASITKAAYDVSGILETARSYAMANNTYTWVGFYEENAGTLTASSDKPPYPGRGRIVLAAVYSKDGTTSCESTGATPGNPVPLTAAGIAPLGKLIKMENVHVTDLGAPAGGDAQTLDGRPGLPYTWNTPNDYQNRISSDDTHASATMYPFTTQGYTFWKTITFNPRGEASINGLSGVPRIAEIGLRPAHGTVPDAASRNVVAIQVTGIGGNVKVYRR